MIRGFLDVADHTGGRVVSWRALGRPRNLEFGEFDRDPHRDLPEHHFETGFVALPFEFGRAAGERQEDAFGDVTGEQAQAQLFEQIEQHRPPAQGAPASLAGLFDALQGENGVERDDAGSCLGHAPGRRGAVSGRFRACSDPLRFVAGE